MIMKRFIYALFLVCLIGTFASAMAEQTPTERVKEGTDKLIKILSNPDMQNPEI